MLSFFKPLLFAGVVAASALLSAPTPSSAQDAASLYTQLKESGAETVYVRGRGFGRGGGMRAGGFGNRGFAGRGVGRGGFAGRRFGNRGFAGRGSYGRQGYGYGYGYRRRGIGGGAVLGGLAAGAIVGGALAAQASQRDDAAASCAQRFRSYDPASGTYLGNDGQRHSCP